MEYNAKNGQIPPQYESKTNVRFSQYTPRNINAISNAEDTDEKEIDDEQTNDAQDDIYVPVTHTNLEAHGCDIQTLYPSYCGMTTQIYDEPTSNPTLDMLPTDADISQINF